MFSDDELRFIASDGGLTEEAKVVLNRELARRGIRDVDVQAYKAALDRDEALRREQLKRRLEHEAKHNRFLTLVYVAILVVFFLVGAYHFFVNGDDNGLGAMVIAVLVLPLFLIMHYARRFVSRVLLRP